MRRYAARSPVAWLVTVCAVAACTASPPAPPSTATPATIPTSTTSTSTSPTMVSTPAWRVTRSGPDTAYRLDPAPPGVFAVPAAPPAGATWRTAGSRAWAVGPAGVLAVRARPATVTLAADQSGLRAVVPAGSGPVTVEVTPRLVESADWVTRNGERALRVEPTWAARGWFLGGAAVWQQVVAAAPAADTPGMADQLVCHVQFAPDKTAWFLEPRRPAVGYAATVAAGCNPGQVPDAG